MSDDNSSQSDDDLCSNQAKLMSSHDQLNHSFSQDTTRTSAFESPPRAVNLNNQDSTMITPYNSMTLTDSHVSHSSFDALSSTNLVSQQPLTSSQVESLSESQTESPIEILNESQLEYSAVSQSLNQSQTETISQTSIEKQKKRPIKINPNLPSYLYNNSTVKGAERQTLREEWISQFNHKDIILTSNQIEIESIGGLDYACINHKMLLTFCRPYNIPYGAKRTMDSLGKVLLEKVKSGTMMSKLKSSLEDNLKKSKASKPKCITKDGTLFRKYITHVERALGSQRTILKNDRKK